MGHRKHPDSFVCQGCDAVIERLPSPQIDNRRMYCSPLCKMHVWWRTHERKIYPPAAATLQRRQRQRQLAADRSREQYLEDQRRREIQREIDRAQQLHAASFCRDCGVPIIPGRGRCEQCRLVIDRRTWVDHVCPNCGKPFEQDDDVVYCSRKCGHQYRHHPGRYPSIALIPRAERNRIAHLIALVRAARRHIDIDQQPPRAGG